MVSESLASRQWQVAAPMFPEETAAVDSDCLRGKRTSIAGFSSPSPLRYPGGKTKAFRTIRQFIPDGLDELCSPFAGGASIEIMLANEGTRVHASDAFQPLVNFWQCALNSPVRLADNASLYNPLPKERFYELQRTYNELEGGFNKAVVFYVLNRASFSGTTLSGGMSPGHPRFTKSAIERLRQFRCPGMLVLLRDYRDALCEHPGTFLYLDPPYEIDQRLYGERGNHHDGFGHEQLAEVLRERQGWVMSYNDSPEIRKRYDFARIVKVDWTYGMSAKGNRNGKEVLIIRE